MHLTAVDLLIIVSYVDFVLAIGVALKDRVAHSADFFLAGRSIPAWVAGLACLSANLGAQEVVGMAASGAEYGPMGGAAMVLLARRAEAFRDGGKPGHCRRNELR